MSGSDLDKFKAMQAEDRRLRLIVSELLLDIAAIKEIAKGEW